LYEKFVKNLKIPQLSVSEEVGILNAIKKKLKELYFLHMKPFKYAH